MQNIFYGMVLSFLNFSFNIGNCKIGLIPDFLGYILILKGVREIVSESEYFTKIELHIKLMVLYTLFLYIMDLLGNSSHINDIFNIVLGIIFAIIALYIVYNIIMGIIDIEKINNYNLKSDILYSLWKARVISTVLVYLTVFIPAIMLIVIMIGFIVNIGFIIKFNDSKNLYYKLKNQS